MGPSDLDLGQDLGALLRTCIEAYGAYGGLKALSANLHLLALNAEFAAGRAGRRGAGIRVLTQSTRDFGRTLGETAGHLDVIRSRIYGQGARAMLHLARYEKLADAAFRSGDRVVVAAADRALSLVVEAVDALAQLVTMLGRQDRVFADYIAQSHHIAMTIAIEAASVGSAGGEFFHVADTMKGYVGVLGDMVNRSNRAVAAALDIAGALSGRTGAMSFRMGRRA